MNVQKRDSNACLADGATLEEVAAALRMAKQTVWRIEQAAIRRIWREQVREEKGAT